MMESVSVYVLTALTIDPEGTVASRNIGVTLNLHEA